MKWKLATVPPVEDEGELTNYHIENLKGERIKKYKVGDTIVLVIETQNKIGDTLEINLNDKEADFEHMGTRLQDDLLEHTVQNDIDRIELKVIEELEEETS